MSEWTKNVVIDDRFESYQDIFSDDWCHRMNDLVEAGSPFRSLLWDLIADWRGAAYTASFPSQLVRHMQTFADGYVNASNTDGGILRFADVVLMRLSGEIHELCMHKQLQERLHTRVVTLAAEIRDTRDAIKVELPMEKMWRDYLGNHVFKVTIWSAMRLCYVAVYNAYDNFAGRCLAVAAKGTTTRTTATNFEREFAESFGPDVLQKCWSGKQIRTARLVRHALSHAAGRETPELAQSGHSLRRDAGEVHILPDDLKALYETLKSAAGTLVERAGHIAD